MAAVSGERGIAHLAEKHGWRNLLPHYLWAVRAGRLKAGSPGA